MSQSLAPSSCTYEPPTTNHYGGWTSHVSPSTPTNLEPIWSFNESATGYQQLYTHQHQQPAQNIDYQHSEQFQEI